MSSSLNGIAPLFAHHTKTSGCAVFLTSRTCNSNNLIACEIDVIALRQFQSIHHSPAKDFKPVPDGFEEDMGLYRKALPKGEEA